ncbi:MAG: hypothetical protein NWF01_07750 [Candidatus Bathyarchaeota archaeon]|nr:hypothetical protein [Candidatus Bathyarchaeota archaeon]
MSEKKGETVLEQFGFKRFYYRERSPSQGRRALCAVLPVIVDSNLPECCEFAQDKVSERSEGRFCCVDGKYCSPAFFRNPTVFGDCEVRLAELAKEKT